MSAPNLPSLLFQRGTSWQGAVRGSTNILADLFLRAGYPVTWLTRPIHAGHVLRGWRRGNRLRFATESVRYLDGALELSPFTAFPILKYSFLGARLWSASARLGYYTIYPSLPHVFKAANQPAPDLIWTTGGDGGALRRAFPKARRIVQCVDIYEAYAGSAQNRLEVEDYRDADAVVTIGHALAAYLIRERGVPAEKITVIGQGADLELFAVRHPEPEDIASAAHPRLIWVGVLAKADPKLMEAALASLPAGEGSLVLVGPVAPWAQALAAHDPRIRVLGARPADKAAAYLQHSDIGLMLYDRGRDPRQYEGQNPLKLYEMAAAGLPIISTSHHEFHYVAHPALIAGTPETVKEAVKEALTRRIELAAASLNFADRNGWELRFREAEMLTQQVLQKGKCL